MRRSRLTKFPRSSERGSIEGIHVHLPSITTQVGFHVRVNVAPLKGVGPGGVWTFLVTFPRSSERGSIEGTSSGAR